ncbi:NAD(P)H-dependent oxidoreductase [Nonomuraea sp. NPDC005983]|uniref:NADPH-dependent FMN reductase n=1 Tax=Nonomuraea sp. NPDC005983 TaxID=3155595 RepID=UPI0033B26D10
MPEEPLELAMIVGSVRDGRLGPTVANWIAGQARERDDWNVDVIDLAEIDLPLVLPDFGGPRPSASSTPGASSTRTGSRPTPPAATPPPRPCSTSSPGGR